MRIQSDSQTPRMGMHLGQGITGLELKCHLSLALGSSLCCISLHTDLLFPRPHCKEKAIVNNSLVYISIQKSLWTELESFWFLNFQEELWSNNGSFSDVKGEFPWKRGCVQYVTSNMVKFFIHQSQVDHFLVQCLWGSHLNYFLKLPCYRLNCVSRKDNLEVLTTSMSGCNLI